MNGFVACRNGAPITLELNDEIVGGLLVGEPVPVFVDADDAREAALSNQSRYGSKVTFEIRHVTLTLGEVHSVAEYDEDTDETFGIDE